VSRYRHYRTTRQLDAIVDGELQARFEGLVTRHLSECPECTREVAVRRAIKDTLSRYGADPEVLARIERYSGELRNRA